MKIGWITPFSLIDYPWKSSCIIFTVGCNFRCGYCHNPDLVVPERIIDMNKFSIGEDVFFSFLEKRKWLLEGVSICGWEPTIQNDLYDFCKKIKSLGFLVKLDTNGRDPKILQQLISDSLVDYVAMDIKQSPEKLESLIQVSIDMTPYEKSIDILLQWNVDYEFRTTCIKNHHTGDDICCIAQGIQWAKNYYLQNFRKWNTLDTSFDGVSFSENELRNFQMVASKYVDKCWIRL